MSLIDKLFGIELETVTKNKESEAEPVQVSKENILRLSCHIDNNNNPVSHLNEGLKVSLETEIEKNSPYLDKNCIYLSQSKINKLPSYLTI
mmetsp:Transcript_30724/g.22809  ORF Transcript_30724/g.22809 Transcript_30724/m.22809 type:complete len:91 (-) Transcript_30724:596-868(-)